MTSDNIISVPSKAASLAGKPKRILCLHGAYQSASMFYSKIGGARRKLSRVYELDFLEGPLEMEQESEGVVDCTNVPRAWWRRDDDGRHILVKEAFDYVRKETNGRQYDAIIGFSQGGTLATALCQSDTFPGVKAVVTAGAPLVEEAFTVATDIAAARGDSDTVASNRLEIPKLHIAGERDDLVDVDWTRALCERGGGGDVLVHEQGHLFPTRAAIVNQVIEFLGKSLQEDKSR